jgi:hypothetical protein
MSWLYSRVLVAEYLGDICSDGEPSAPLSGNPIQQAYCAPDKMTDFSRLSRYGMTFKPLTEDRGEELLKSYREVFLARTLAQREEELVSQENAQACGNTWPGLLARFDQDSHSWKIPQCSLFEDLELSLETWPKWGLMLGGVSWEQTPLVLPTSETVYGFSLPTPVASDATTGELIGKNDTFYTTSTGIPRKVNQKGTDGSVGLARLVQMWPTPKCSDSRHAISRHITDPEGFWKSNLGEVVMSTENPANGRLNPQWVEWLMGWPLGWTDLKPLEMDKSHFVQQPPGSS